MGEGKPFSAPTLGEFSLLSSCVALAALVASSCGGTSGTSEGSENTGGASGSSGGGTTGDPATGGTMTDGRGGSPSGQAGNGTAGASTATVPRWSIAAGYTHTCAVVEEAVRCWGTDDDGELGSGLQGASSTPVQVVGL